MTELLLAALFAAFVWWFATGAILYLDGMPQRSFRASLWALALLALAALIALGLTRHEASARNAYIAFTSAIVVWGWIELAFLTGVITGPRKTGSAVHANLRQRFVQALEALAYHELVIALAAALVLALTLGQANAVGAWTFIVLWAMRSSAKLNLFFGVRNDGRDMLPERMLYLASFFGRKRVNLLFPLSILASTAVSVLLIQHVLTSTAEDVTGIALVAALLVLGIIEHIFMVLPLPVNALWSWGLRSRSAPR